MQLRLARTLLRTGLQRLKARGAYIESVLSRCSTKLIEVQAKGSPGSNPLEHQTFEQEDFFGGPSRPAAEGDASVDEDLDSLMQQPGGLEVVSPVSLYGGLSVLELDGLNGSVSRDRIEFHKATAHEIHLDRSEHAKMGPVALAPSEVFVKGHSFDGKKDDGVERTDVGGAFNDDSAEDGAESLSSFHSDPAAHDAELDSGEPDMLDTYEPEDGSVPSLSSSLRSSRRVSLADRVGISERDPGWRDRMAELDANLGPVSPFQTSDSAAWRRSSVAFDERLPSLSLDGSPINAAVAIMKRRTLPVKSAIVVSTTGKHAYGPATVDQSPLKGHGVMGRHLHQLRRKYGLESLLPVPALALNSLEDGDALSPLPRTGSSDDERSELGGVGAMVSLTSLATPRDEVILSALGDAAKRREKVKKEEAEFRLTQGMFRKFDKAGRGALNKDEVRRAAQHGLMRGVQLGSLLRELGHPMTPRDVERAFTAMDINNDG